MTKETKPEQRVESSGGSPAGDLPLMMRYVTCIAAAATCAPVAGLIVVYYYFWRAFDALAHNAPEGRLASHISSVLWAGLISVTIFAIGFRLHLFVSRRLRVARPWVWTQVFFMGLIIVFYFPAILPFGVIPLAFTLKFSEMKRLNAKQVDSGDPDQGL